MLSCGKRPSNWARIGSIVSGKKPLSANSTSCWLQLRAIARAVTTYASMHGAPLCTLQVDYDAHKWQRVSLESRIALEVDEFEASTSRVTKLLVLSDDCFPNAWSRAVLDRSILTESSIRTKSPM
jgi:hypothetical protein